MWYMDCYSYKAACGRSFPVNSFFNESLEVLTEAANRILGNSSSGIDAITIGKETKGQAPKRLNRDG